MTGPVVPVAAIEALASDLRKSAKGIRQATGDHQDGREYEAAADRLDALVAEHQTEVEPAPEVRLTDAEQERIVTEFQESRNAWDFLAMVEAIVASRTADLRADYMTRSRTAGEWLRERDRARAEVERLKGRIAEVAGVAEERGYDLAALRERVAETVERVQGEHRPTGRINSREGCVLCECDAKLPVTGGYTRDGLEVEEWAERRAFEAHIAQQVAAALGGEDR